MNRIDVNNTIAANIGKWTDFYSENEIKAILQNKQAKFRTMVMLGS